MGAASWEEINARMVQMHAYNKFIQHDSFTLILTSLLQIQKELDRFICPLGAPFVKHKENLAYLGDLINNKCQYLNEDKSLSEDKRTLISENRQQANELYTSLVIKTSKMTAVMKMSVFRVPEFSPHHGNHHPESIRSDKNVDFFKFGLSGTAIFPAVLLNVVLLKLQLSERVSLRSLCKEMYRVVNELACQEEYIYCRGHIIATKKNVSEEKAENNNNKLGLTYSMISKASFFSGLHKSKSLNSEKMERELHLQSGKKS